MRTTEPFGFVVLCPDGRMRHDEPFETHSEAADFADYGHPCRHPHRVRKVTLDERPGVEPGSIWHQPLEHDAEWSPEVRA